MRKLSALSVGLALSCMLGLAVIASAQPIETSSGAVPRHAGQLWGNIKTSAGNQSVQGVAVVVYHIKHGKPGESVAQGTTDATGSYSIAIGSLPAGVYLVRVQAPTTGGYQGGQTRTKLRGPKASKHIDWMLSGQSPAQPVTRWTKVPAAAAK
ncbi:MAG: carboxypeptidase regulatory-like domain-containing protein [Candidatus Binataceae bacterium]|nr:carboxypeptidase regulatory-like domain-containing protein [Candidatus Binataceae bacterium]